MQFDEQHNGEQVVLDSGTAFAVYLREQPTTGYRWRVDSSGEPACQLRGDTFDGDASGHGGGGVRVLHFETVEAGLGVIELAYRRAWETDAPPARQFTLRVQVAATAT
jgi:inhibitor of cysteine peptidase